jgi:isopenicillin-N epimerase
MSELRRHWDLDPEIRYLNHGSFGACPRRVLERQSELRSRLEREPVRFLMREAPRRLDEAREVLAAHLRAEAAGLAFVTNATTAVNAVLRSLDLQAGDELLVTDQAYNACRNALDFVAHRAHAKVVVARLPARVEQAGDLIAPILNACSSRTRMALLDHITSPTALLLPMEEIVPALSARGVDCLVDGAHAPGAIDLNLEDLGCAWYTGNAHKWLCAPKGAAFLYTRADRRSSTRPAVISHGANAPLAGRDRYRLEFDWLGTSDPSPWLCIPEALEFLPSLVKGDWDTVRRRNRELAHRARLHFVEKLGLRAIGPAESSLPIVSFELPPAEPEGTVDHLWIDALQDQLYEEDRIEVPIFPFPAPPARHMRISAQLYNTMADYEALADALMTRL